MPDRLLDTNAIAAAMKSHVSLERYLSRIDGDGSLLTSVVAEGEMLFGIARLPAGRRKRDLAQALKQVMTRMDEVLPITRETARRYSEVKSDLWGRGKPMGENDVWLAATGLERGLILVTSDGRFRNVADLAVEDWSAGQD